MGNVAAGKVLGREAGDALGLQEEPLALGCCCWWVLSLCCWWVCAELSHHRHWQAAVQGLWKPRRSTCSANKSISSFVSKQSRELGTEGRKSVLTASTQMHVDPWG